MSPSRIDALLPAFHEGEGTSGFLCTVSCRVAISKVLERRRVLLPLAGARWLIRRLKRLRSIDALEAAWSLGGDRALMLAIDEVFASAPKRSRPRCGGAPIPWPWEPARVAHHPGDRPPPRKRKVCPDCGWSDGVDNESQQCHRCGATWED